MRNQFNVLIPFKGLANAAAFLEREGFELRSRNQLVNECVRYVEALAEQGGCLVANDDLEAFNFLLERGLTGELGKSSAKAGQQVKALEVTREEEIVKQVVSNIRARKASGKKFEASVPTEAKVLDAAQRSAESGETLEEFHEFALAAFPGALGSEALREKVSKLFNKEIK